jgi:hypothetical protein
VEWTLHRLHADEAMLLWLLSVAAIVAGTCVPWQALAMWLTCQWPMIELTAGVPTCGWPAGGMASLAEADTPQRLRGDTLPSAAWHAHRRWHSASYVGRTFGLLRRVWQRPAQADESTASSRSFVYFAERGEAGGAFGMRAPLDAPPSSSLVTEHDMSAATFVSAAVAADRLLYCSHDLSALGSASSADVHPLAAFDLRSVEHQQLKPTRGIVWLGTGRPITHAHYDTAHSALPRSHRRAAQRICSPARPKRVRAQISLCKSSGASASRCGRLARKTACGSYPRATRCTASRPSPTLRARPSATLCT